MLRSIVCLLLTALVPRGEGEVRPLPASSQDISDLTISGIMGETLSFEDFLRKTHTDAFLVLCRGKIVYQWGNIHDAHALWSISKGFIGVLAGIAAEKGKLDIEKKVSYYLPELKGTHYGDATIDQLLDMEVVVPDDQIVLPPNTTIDEFAPTLKKGDPHGKVFFYTSITTEVLAWVLERVTGTPIPELLSGNIWEKIGAEGNGFYQVDHRGRAKAGGGLNASAIDLARFGLALFEGKITSQNWLQKTFWEGDGKVFHKSLFSLAMPEGSYEDQWWKFNGNEGPFLALGIHGQYMWIDPKEGLLIVKLSSEPNPVDLEYSFLTIMMMKKLEGVIRCTL